MSSTNCIHRCRDGTVRNGDPQMYSVMRKHDHAPLLIIAYWSHTARLTWINRLNQPEIPITEKFRPLRKATERRERRTDKEGGRAKQSVKNDGWAVEHWSGHHYRYSTRLPHLPGKRGHMAMALAPHLDASKKIVECVGRDPATTSLPTPTHPAPPVHAT